MLALNMILATLAAFATAQSMNMSMDHGDHNAATTLIVATDEPVIPTTVTTVPPAVDTGVAPIVGEDLTTITQIKISTTMAPTAGAGGEHDHGPGMMPSMDHGNGSVPTQTALPVPTGGASMAHFSSGLIAIVAAFAFAAQY
ncbi:hypothetical protein MCOR27_007044 [Pyricularia oryzae]|uniref:Uncharacterized protein n=1 Tax=Pyricularia grisea TaxID=148305 RepID=A0ABQ8NLQ8_PYRGI|nr:hypothetical protein MCOR01_002159 [Pyricularia oryzae]KAI6299029.1 hypothetical protein MCOR33_004976 [Pyricularia grisea]KAH9429257.1 hypothetical protein MCOR02_010663 [Pyricularia oryzae]KAI6261255.1 hypothetical protein MCOR19_002429 [Pyricularia oryzae]KAI6275330.1 hypothetical protein MCOR27_007044 [Pyricularia oryzae]